MDLLGGPTADLSAAVQQNLEQTDDAHVMDFDTGISDRADGDGERDALDRIREQAAASDSSSRPVPMS